MYAIPQECNRARNVILMRPSLRTAVPLVMSWSLIATSAVAQGVYVPPSGTWEKRPAAQLGLLQSSVDSAVKLAITAPTALKISNKC